MFNLNIIYIFFIIFYLCVYLKKNKTKENFTVLDKNTIDEAVNKNYFFDIESIKNMNTIINNFDQKNKLEIPAHLNLSEAKIIVDKDTKIYSGSNKIDFLNTIIRSDDVISLTGDTPNMIKNSKGKHWVDRNPRFVTLGNEWRALMHHFNNDTKKLKKPIAEINDSIKDFWYHHFKVNDIDQISLLKKENEFWKKPYDTLTDEEKNLYKEFINLYRYIHSDDQEQLDNPEGFFADGKSYASNYKGSFNHRNYIDKKSSAHNSKEAYFYRKKAIEKCNQEQSNSSFCKEVKSFVPLPKLKKDGIII